MKTQYYTASSLDGFIATEDHSLEWLFPLVDLEATSYPTFVAEVGALAMGSSTYEWLLKHVIKLGTPDETVWPYSQPAWVFSRRNLVAQAGADIRFVQGDVRLVRSNENRSWIEKYLDCRRRGSCWAVFRCEPPRRDHCSNRLRYARWR